MRLRTLIRKCVFFCCASINRDLAGAKKTSTQQNYFNLNNTFSNYVYSCCRLKPTNCQGFHIWPLDDNLLEIFSSSSSLFCTTKENKNYLMVDGRGRKLWDEGEKRKGRRNWLPSELFRHSFTLVVHTTTKE